MIYDLQNQCKRNESKWSLFYLNLNEIACIQKLYKINYNIAN